MDLCKVGGERGNDSFSVAEKTETQRNSKHRSTRQRIGGLHHWWLMLVVWWGMLGMACIWTVLFSCFLLINNTYQLIHPDLKIEQLQLIASDVWAPHIASTVWRKAQRSLTPANYIQHHGNRLFKAWQEQMRVRMRVTERASNRHPISLMSTSCWPISILCRWDFQPPLPLPISCSAMAES